MTLIAPLPPTTLGNTPATDLRNAALVIEHAGWVQGAAIGRVSGKVCALGALWIATGMRPAHVPQAWGDGEFWQLAGSEDGERFALAVRVLARWVGLPPAEFNDNRACSAVVVTTAMRDAADDWERRHLPPSQADLVLAAGPTK